MSVRFPFNNEHRAYNLRVATMYNIIGSPMFGADRIGLVAKMAFISSNPAVTASVHSKCLVCRRRR